MLRFMQKVYQWVEQLGFIVIGLVFLASVVIFTVWLILVVFS